MMPRSLSQTGPEKRRFTWPKGTPQIIALLLVLLVDSLVAPHFYQVVLQDGRLFGSPIDILNRAAPVALLAIGMTLVIATGGIDLSVGAVMAIAGATRLDDRRRAQPAGGAVGRAGRGRAGRIVERHPRGGP